jgi:hypothetical protein
VKTFQRINQYHHSWIGGFCLIIFLLVIVVPANADDDDSRPAYTPIQVSFFPGFGTHPKGDVEVDFSVNILAGKVYRVNKFEIGTLLNWDVEEMRGFQIVGGINYVGETANGVQLAGIGNITPGNTRGIQLAGVVNYSGGEATGIGLSGIMNYVQEDAVGINLSGLVNYSGRDYTGIGLAGLLNYSGGESMGIYLSEIMNYVGATGTGIYLSGLANYTEDEAIGIHLSGILNYSGDYIGIEMALANVAEDVEGMQIGIVNYAKSLDGLPIGLISYVKQVGVRFDAWTSETAALTVALRSGNRKYYNLLAFGANPYGDELHYMLGWGIGHEYYLRKNNFLDLDLMIYAVAFADYEWEKTNALYKFRVLYGHDFKERFSIYGGPTLNLFASEVESAEDIALWAPEEKTWKKGSMKYYFWPGLVFGIRF